MPKLLYLVTEDWFFCSHFLPMARAAKSTGFEVSVATRIRDHGPAIASEGFRLLPLATDRRSLSPSKAVKTFVSTLRLLLAERPDVVHCVALPMVVLGGTAARLAGIRSIILAPTGLGHLWVENRLKDRIARFLTRLAVMVLGRQHVHFLFENADDPREFSIDPADTARVTLVGGAGVDARAFSPSPEPAAPPLKVAIVSRMITSKGISEAVSAVILARSRGADIELHLFGVPDEENRRSIPPSRLGEWSQLPGIIWHGAATDVAQVWRDHHVALLLSYREGAPRSLIEAAACGRPIVATDVTGCREIVAHGENGILVPLYDIAATANAISRLAADSQLRVQLGRRGRSRFEERFTETAVADAVVAVYGRAGTRERQSRRLDPLKRCME